MLGPIDYIAVSFKGNNFKGEILSELKKVIDQGLVRLVDLLVIVKDENGDVAVIELSDLPEIEKIFGNYEKDMVGLLSEEDAEEIAKDLDNNSSAGLLIVEHLWAKGFKKAILNANGKLIAEGRIHPDVVQEALNEVNSK